MMIKNVNVIIKPAFHSIFPKTFQKVIQTPKKRKYKTGEVQ